MYRILHLFRMAVFTPEYINFINQSFDAASHTFLIFGESFAEGLNQRLLYQKNVRKRRVLSKEVLERLKDDISDYDKIIYHGVFEGHILDFFFENKKLLKKLYLYFWGGDKFIWHNGTVKQRYVINNARGIITILPEEIVYIRKNYRIKGKVFMARYYSDHIVNLLSDLKKNDNRKNDEIINIQLGHSAVFSNQHIKVLKMLLPYRDEKIQIYAPLSYGDMEYAKRVIRAGEKLFGEKFTPITDFMDDNLYYSFMTNMDVGIFGMKRQQALGNIQALLVYGCKVYLCRNSILSYYWRKDCGCVIGDYEDIGKMEYKDFIALSDTDRRNNYKNALKIIGLDEYIRHWKVIFDD